MARIEERTQSPRRAEMVRAAARLFSERGYHGTSMQHLGDALGLLRGSLYAHISGKEELLFDVVDEGAERFLARGAEAVAADATAAERLKMLLVGHVETAARHLDAATVFLNEWRYLSNELRAVIQEKRDRYEAMVTKIVEEGIAASEFRADIDARLAVLLVLSAANWTYEWYRPGGRLTPKEVGERFADLIVEGIEVRKGGER